MQQYKKDFIEFMIECGVLTFGDFITKSGRKIQIYFDVQLVLALEREMFSFTTRPKPFQFTYQKQDID